MRDAIDAAAAALAQARAALGERADPSSDSTAGPSSTEEPRTRAAARAEILVDAVRHLARARQLADQALDEAMAAAVVAGASVRTVAAEAGVAPNSVPPRLATTEILAGYSAADGRVSAEGVARARYDAQRGLPAPAPGSGSATAPGPKPSPLSHLPHPPTTPPPAGMAPLRFRRRRSD